MSRTSAASGRLMCGLALEHSIIRRHNRWLPALALVILLMLMNCAPKKVTYYKPGGDQYKLDIDSKQCLENAKMMAQSKMVNPEAEPDPNFVQKYYQGCLYARGWSQIPLDKRDRALWQWEGRNLYLETFTIELPPGYSLRTEAKFVIGPTWSHQLQAQGPHRRTNLILVAQENISNPFEIINYPPPNGYVLYTGGRLDKFDVRWSVFTGQYGQTLVAILGAYIYLEKTQRVSVIFSRTLTSSGKPLKGYSLSLAQNKELEEIYPTWLTWLKEQTGSKELEEKPSLSRYFRFLWGR